MEVKGFPLNTISLSHCWSITYKYRSFLAVRKLFTSTGAFFRLKRGPGWMCVVGVGGWGKMVGMTPTLIKFSINVQFKHKTQVTDDRFCVGPCICICICSDL